MQQPANSAPSFYLWNTGDDSSTLVALIAILVKAQGYGRLDDLVSESGESLKQSVSDLSTRVYGTSTRNTLSATQQLMNTAGHILGKFGL